MTFSPTILDYGVGNLLSVQRSFNRIGVSANVCSDVDLVEKAEAIVLPGVGAFRDARAKLHESGLDQAIMSFARSGKPLLGICLGMQLLARWSDENGRHEGLGLINAEVVKFELSETDLRLPHMGWNAVVALEKSALFEGVPQGADFYFVHSYHVRCRDSEDIEATCVYGREFSCAVRRDNVMGVQFHPEKSQKYGRRVLENFVRLAESMG